MAAAAVRSALDASISLSWSWEGDTSLPVCVLLHGWMGCKEDWGGPVIGAVHSAGWSSLSIDLPGHGESLPTGRGAWRPLTIPRRRIAESDAKYQGDGTGYELKAIFEEVISEPQNPAQSTSMNLKRTRRVGSLR